ncbi:MAG: amino acid adenylation domain-containing protein [Myxococcaceae bacterium]|nr:amino acid adenylation domain-containing protein [Myxococcaceae bacterium]
MPIENRLPAGEAALALTHPQRRIWWAEQLEPGTPLGNISGLMHVSGPCDAALLARAVERFVADTPSLRTELFLQEGEPRQHVVERGPVSVPVVDFSGADEPRAALHAWAEERCRRPFMLVGSPLYDFAVLRAGASYTVLFARVHHLICDASSMALFTRGVSRLYERMLEGKEEAGSTKAAGDYRRFAAGEQAYLASPEAAEDLASWRELFQGLEEPSLLGDPAAGFGRTEAVRHSIELAPEETAALTALIREQQTTVNRFFTALTALFVARLTGRSDVCLGGFVHNRPTREDLRTYGMFVSTVPQRLTVDPARPLAEVLPEVGARLHRFLKLSRYPYDVLLERLGGGSRRTGLFDVVVSHQSHPHGATLAGSPVDIEWLFNGHEVHSLVVQVSDRTQRGQLRVDLDFRRAAFPEEQPAELAESFGHLLREALASGAARRAMSTLSLVSPGQRERLSRLHGPAGDYAREQTVHGLFAERVARHPERPALRAGGAVLTYGELDARGERLADALVAHGVGSGDTVGLMTSRSAELLVGQLGVLKAGAAYLPIDPAFPVERVRYMLEDARARLLVVDARTREAAGALGVELVDAGAPAAGASLGGERRAASATELAYVIFTSGSLGKPKGVMLEHRGVVNFMEAMVRVLPLEEGTRVLCTTTPSFDIFVLETLLPLTRGLEVVLASEEEQRLPDLLAARVLADRCDVVQLTPSRLQLLLAHPAGQAALRSVKAVLVGGEALPPQVLRTLQDRTSARIFNLYGPTETTVWSTAAELTQALHVHVGRPLLNTQVYVVGAMGDLLPPGAVGELLIGGDGVARGYLNRPELTRERFIEAPAWGTGRLYRTGDRGRWLADGTLEHRGRVDHQVKVRGYRVELGEIESQILASGMASGAAVVRREDAGGNAFLAAFFVPKGEASGLRAHLSRVLPDYMVPTYLVPLEALPVLASGKVDRNALPAVTAAATAREIEPPSNPTEEQLLALWRQVLGVEGFGVTDSFFELGGHSLGAITLANLVAERLGKRVPLARFLAAPTVRELASLLEGAADAWPPLIPTTAAAHHPTTVGQRQLFIQHARAGGADTSYHMTGGLRLEGTLEPARWEEALRQLVRRHEALRTSFALVGEEVVQRVHEEVPFALERLERRGEEPLEAVIQRFVRPFSLEHAPLLRAAWVPEGPERAVLLVDMHHIISDAASVETMLEELLALYDGRALEPPRFQPRDFAAWQRQFLASPVGERLARHWRETFREPPESVAPFPGHAPQAQPSNRGETYEEPFPAELAVRLHEYAREHGGTPYGVLLGAYALLLARHGGARDIAIASPVLGRPHPELAGVVGLFINTVALRLRPEPHLTAEDYLSEVARQSREALEHQAYPFERVVEELRARGLGAPFDFLFVLQDASRSLPAPAGLRVSKLDYLIPAAKFDLTLTAVLGRAPGELSLQWTWRAGHLERAEVTALSRRMMRLMEELLAAPRRSLRALEFLPDDERRLLLEEFNATAQPHPLHRTVVELFEEQVARTPDVPALWHEGKGLTYAELNSRANHLARTLRARGVGPEVRVGLLARPTLEMVVGVLGVLKAGGAYVPMDPGHPAARLELLLRDSAVRHLLWESGPERGLAWEGSVLRFDDEATYASDASDLPRVAGPEHLAYVIYTSGTTGTPKGVAMEHRQLCNQVHWLRRFFQKARSLRHMFLVSPAVDVSVHQIFLPLMRGDCLYLPTYETVISPEALDAYVRRHHIDVVDSVPALLKGLLERPASEGRLDVEYLCFGGDVLSVDVVRLIEKSADIRSLVNYYGPTETCLNAAALMTEDWSQLTRVPIGRPCDNYRIYILDEELRLVPPGYAGELCVGGPSVARGYLGQPELTAEKFVPDPFSHGERMYRTGDVGRWLPDGQLDFVGRVDHQVKIRGYRVETGEVETVLAQQDGVAQAVVEVREEPRAGKQLVAFVVPREGHALQSDTLRAALASRLPPYMVPSAFVALEALPLTISGKVDRKALLAQAAALSPAPEAATAELTPVERRLADIWIECLGVPSVGPQDSFFSLGGQSLLVTRVAARIREVFQVELPLRALFEEPTLADLARRVEQAMREKAAPVLPPVTSVPREGRLPLSASQQRLWLLDQLEPGSPLYNIAGAVRVKGPLEATAVEEAFRALVERHESLRTVFLDDGTGPAAVVLPPPPFTLHRVAPSASEPLEKVLAREGQHAFDLRTGPLFRVTLVRLGAEEHLLVLVLHHIIADGWALTLLTREFAALYEAGRRGESASLPPLAVQYVDYAAWERAHLTDAALAPSLDFWARHLGENPPPLALPTDFPRPALQSSRGTTFSARLPAELSASIRELARRSDATLYMTLLAAFQALLFRYSGQRTLIVGSPVANRQRLETEAVVGCFVNTIALRSDVTARMPFEALLRHVREAALGAQAHQGCGFERLVERLQPARNLGRSPIFQVMFALDEAPEDALRLKELELTPVEVDTGTAKFDLTLGVLDRPDGMQLAFEYNTDLFQRSTLERMAGHLERLLRGVVEAPGRAVGELPLLNAGEQTALLRLAESPGSYPLDRPVHEAFQAQAAATPDAVALEHEGERLTYAELNRRANRLAHHLRSLGVGPETLVGICLERCLDTFVAFLGVLKAGGAYIPMDPGYPADRLRYMLKDSGACFLISRGEYLERVEPGSEVRVLRVEAPDGALSSAPERDPTWAVPPEALAYLIYTSGSTGLPKAVMIPHRALLSYAVGTAQAYGVGPGDRVLQFSTISFDSSVEEIYPCLLRGGALVLRTEGMLDSVRTFLQKCEEWRLTFLCLPTAYWVELAAELERGEVRLPECVRVVGSGGEKMPPARVLAWKRTVSPRVTLTNEYGPTETTVVSAACELATVTEQELHAGGVPLGSAVTNAQLYVLDSELQLCPLGVPGELYIGGENLGRGYLRRPELTAERYVPHPYSRVPGARLYRTGDLARYRESGMLEYLGRIDHQVKFRGYRVELAEIEAVVGQHPSVTDAVVLLREDTPGLQRLVGYLVPRGEAPTRAELRAFLQSRLPEYMVPSAFVVLPAMPIAPGGKVDRGALPPPPRESEVRSAPPSTELERRMAALWEALLRTEGLGVEDDFFELGGHSLLATQLASRVRAELGRELALRTIFEHPRLGDLCRALERQSAASAPTDEKKITRADRSTRRVKR